MPAEIFFTFGPYPFWNISIGVYFTYAATEDVKPIAAAKSIVTGRW